MAVGFRSVVVPNSAAASRVVSKAASRAGWEKMRKGEGEGLTGIMNPFSLLNRYQLDLGSNRTAPTRLSYAELMRRRDSAVDEARAVASKISGDPVLDSIAVDAGRIGEGFRLLIDQPLSLPRQKSALLPVQHGPIALTPISIYNRSTHPRFPLRGAKIKNTTGQHILAGPATVTDAGGYVGDCKLPNLQPNEQRYISFAMDLGLEVRPETPTSGTEYGPVRILEAVIRSCKTTFQSKYRLNNRSTKPRNLLLDHVPQPKYEVVGKNKPIESAKGVLRFAVKVEANKVVEEVVTEQSIGDETRLLSTLTPAWIREMAEMDTTSKPVKEAACRGTETPDPRQPRPAPKSAGSPPGSRRSSTNKSVSAAISTVCRRGPLALKRQVDKFDLLEVELEKTRDKLKAKTAAHETIEKELEAFVRKLDVK